MRWLSVDPATKTGIARWDGPRLVSVATLRPLLAAEQRAHPEAALVLVTGATIIPFATPFAAWGAMLAGAQMVVVEEGMGSAEKSIAQLAFRRGYIAHAAASRGARHIEVNSKRWKKVVGTKYGEKFPGYSKLDKEHAIALVAKHFGLTVLGDEADAILVGVWALEPRVAEAPERKKAKKTRTVQS